MFKYFFGICLFSISLFSQMVVPPPSPSSEREQKVVGGLEWTIGKGYIPALVLGYRNVLIDSDEDVKGISTTLTYDFVKNSFNKLKVSGIYGNEDLTGELSFGYSFISNNFLTGIATQASYVNINADYVLDEGFDYSLQLNSINDN